MQQMNTKLQFIHIFNFSQIWALKLSNSPTNKIYTLNQEKFGDVMKSKIGTNLYCCLSVKSFKGDSCLKTLNLFSFSSPDCFPGGVHWVSVGKQDKSGLLMKLQNLCARLDQDESFSQRLPLNIEEAKDRLRILMLRKHPRYRWSYSVDVCSPSET